MIIGECGGLMYLGKGIIDETGKKHSLVGIFDYSTSLKNKNLALGYRKLKIHNGEKPEGKLTLSGHEFHYSTMVYNKETPHWINTPANKHKQINDGFRKLNCFSFYSHIYWGSNSPWMAFIKTLAK